MTLNQHPVYKWEKLQKKFEALLPAMSVMAVGGIVLGIVITLYYLFFQFNLFRVLVYVLLFIVGLVILIFMELVTRKIEKGLSQK